MRKMAFPLACCLLLSGPAQGAAGDVLTVTGDNVNVRTGPGIDQAVSRQVDRDQRVIEIERAGDWVRAEIEGATGAEGWIHGSLLALIAPAPPQAAEPPTPPTEDAAAAPQPAGGLAPAQAPADPQPEASGTAATAAAAPGAATDPAAAPESIAPAAAPEVAAVDLQRFRDSVDYLNSRAVAVAGAGLFTAVEPLGGGTVQVGATAAWATMPPAGQRSYANTLLDRWAAATGRTGQVKVQIVDESGQVIMEESKP
jgi:Bacterial SH3 domain